MYLGIRFLFLQNLIESILWDHLLLPLNSCRPLSSRQTLRNSLSGMVIVQHINQYTIPKHLKESFPIEIDSIGSLKYVLDYIYLLLFWTIVSQQIRHYISEWAIFALAWPVSKLCWLYAKLCVPILALSVMISLFSVVTLKLQWNIVEHWKICSVCCVSLRIHKPPCHAHSVLCEWRCSGKGTVRK